MPERKLYIWLDSDPLAHPPDRAIEDVPGQADLDLLAKAIAAGRLGTLLPPKLAISPHRRPETPGGYRSIDLGKLLRDYRIPYRVRFELTGQAPLGSPRGAADNQPTKGRKRGRAADAPDAERA
ncbi:hypothetical protein HRbin26_01613 [bacterium HR26]|nr:hypothetical protein HRbin26_01613 [bacterium HR26]